MNSTTDKQLQHFFNNAWFALIFLLVCRIISMCFIPLNDVSESRYAEIARKMLETGNWVTPLHDYGVPFWAKPPLSTWLSALSMKLFGINEFAVRLPGLLLSLATLWLVWDLAKKHSGPFIAMLTALVLAGTLYFFLDAGTVMTDPSLVFCITLVLVAFWHAVVDCSKVWSYVFFIGLGLGLLAKGPVAVVLSGLPIFFWVLLRNQWLNLWQRLPWIKGVFLMLLIALPWYIWAEIRTPGFLNYFIVGENFNRFLKPGWTGDKYGYAHKQPWGMIWIYAASGIFPWCLLGVAWFIKYRHNVRKVFADKDGWLSYFFLCTVVPLFFFTFSSNIIYTYVFPSIPAFSLFFVEYWNRVDAIAKAKQLIIGLSVVIGVIFLLATFAFNALPEVVSKTQKSVVAAWVKQNPAAGSALIYWDYKVDFSAQFYSGGRAKSAFSNKKLCELLHNGRENYLAIEPHDTRKISPVLFSRMILLQRVFAGDKPILLMRIPVSVKDFCNNK
ncbi:glycosyltransferase family 39 protein [Fluoribacter dumoffii]|uniref:Undecaprenyl phosphate-alpha-4-amino-4-deoxy-L-arabinose arabinosyl transferase n=1 Tax=Fluoribacter dumoffii TaxID=463 RepID=A0A377GCH8_9GAMM|nr:glycosyltransferase family 39 protein [Fluoribacter dumoffii]KTC90712.1 dolichyl-phosphate-mannose-protein mannosyltransferase [Fluoribacter dumoffii NY 23]MCW8386392.1 glycosyltransferase family 39 protein [Fluoribacter dumoffii]MCW8419445.1 glycosyltransferase family 39 protein [Fluoribacter dumoffii]MCW8452680.1 glycosyltransferase family 39 protein [Fluoribacter dumoffii]MCW8460070.1 glycosyltransferase family 39 protein [Fluoribacter dumoffii]